MSTFSKLLGLAKKAAGSSGSLGAPGSPGSPGSTKQNAASGGTDWRSLVRSAADAVTGDSRPAMSGSPGGGALAGGAVAGAGLAAGGVLAVVAGGAVVGSVAGPLLEQATNLGVDFDSLASAVDVTGLAGGLDELASGAGETMSGLGDQASGIGEQLSGLGSNVGLPSLDDLFGR